MIIGTVTLKPATQLVAVPPPLPYCFQYLHHNIYMLTIVFTCLVTHTMEVEKQYPIILSMGMLPTMHFLNSKHDKAEANQQSLTLLEDPIQHPV